MLLGPPAAGRPDEAGFFWTAGGVSVFLPASSISTFPPVTPTRWGGRAAGILFSACSHGGALGGFLLFSIKKKKKENFPNTHISRNQ